MPRSVTITQSERSSTQSARGFVTTTTITTTTTTTTTTTSMPRSRSNRLVLNQRALLRSHAQQSVAQSETTTSPSSTERFLQHMLEEPHLAEFYANIWGDSDRETTKLRRGRARRRAASPLVDIAQVAHVVTSMSDYRSDYVPIAAMSKNTAADVTNLWAQDADGGDTDAALDSDSDDSAASDAHVPVSDVPIMSLYTSRSAVHATARSGVPFRISEASDEDSVIEDARDAAAVNSSFDCYDAADKHTEPRNSDPLTSDASDSDVFGGPLSNAPATCATSITDVASTTTSIHAVYTSEPRSNASLLFITGADVQSTATATPVPVPPPSSHRNGSVVFSAVFSENHQRWNWASKFLLGIHEPLRHALFVMDRFLDQTELQQQEPQSQAREQHVRAFVAWFKTYFCEYLACQHKLKTSVLHPLLQLRVATKVEIGASYDEIFRVVEQIKSYERDLSATSSSSIGHPDTVALWTARLDVLQREVRRLYLTMHTVLNLEENTLHPALSATFSERTFHQYVMPRVFRSIKAKRVIVPWILDRSKIWGGASEQQSIQRMLPFSARFLYRKFWRPYFETHVVSVMKSLNEFVTPGCAVPEADSSNSTGGCSIQ